jgi:hypothetical protein
MHLDFATSTTAPPRLLHSVRRRASTIRRVGPRNRCPQQSCTGRGIIRFLRSNLCDCCMLLQVLHHSPSASSSDACRGSSPSTRTLSGRSSSSSNHHRTSSDRSSSSSDHRRQGTASHARFSSPIISYIFNMLIYVDMILLDNMLQYLLFIAMIDLSRICDSSATLICNTLVMLIIYS